MIGPLVGAAENPCAPHQTSESAETSNKARVQQYPYEFIAASGGGSGGDLNLKTEQTDVKQRRRRSLSAQGQGAGAASARPAPALTLAEYELLYRALNAERGAGQSLALPQPQHVKLEEGL